jgi:hypothetical protein
MSQPRNDLEQLIASAMNGEIDPETFASRILPMQVFMPVRDEKHQIAGFQSSTKAEPLILEGEDEQRILVLFTAPERAKPLKAHFPDYGGGLLTEFSWVLARMAAGMAITLNPEQELGFDFDPEMVAMMTALLPEDPLQ